MKQHTPCSIASATVLISTLRLRTAACTLHKTHCCSNDHTLLSALEDGWEDKTGGKGKRGTEGRWRGEERLGGGRRVGGKGRRKVGEAEGVERKDVMCVWRWRTDGEVGHFVSSDLGRGPSALVYC